MSDGVIHAYEIIEVNSSGMEMTQTTKESPMG